MMKKLLLVMAVCTAAIFIGCVNTMDKTGIECSNSLQGSFVPLAMVKEHAPTEFSELITNAQDDAVEKCIDNDMFNAAAKYGAARCAMCGWICATESPFFYRFQNNDASGKYNYVDVHIWDVECIGTGLEYRKEGIEKKKGALFPSDQMQIMP